MSRPAARADLRFALAVAATLVGVLVTLRLATGAGFGTAFGAPAADGTVATGVVEFPDDNFAYLSLVEQGRSGAWSLINAFAWEERSPIYVNPLFLGLGRIAGWLGIRASGALQLAGLASVFVVVLGAAAIAGAIGLGRAASRWVAVSIAFGSGLSAWGALLSVPALIGVDRTHQDTIAFSAFAVYPYQATTLAVLTLAVLATVRGHRKTAAALALLGATMRPYECVLFLASLGVFAAATRDRARMRTFALLALTTAPACGYALWIGEQPAWRDYARVTLEQIDVRRLAWFVGYGGFLPAAALGVWSARRHATVRWFALWIAALLVLVAGIAIDEVKIASGAQLPLAVLAGAGLASAARRFGTVCVAVAAAALFLPATAHLLCNVYEAHRIDADLVECAEHARESGATRVLCDTPTGRLLPGLVACRVYAGHWSMTPAYRERRQRLVRAGCEADPGVTPVQAEFERLLTAADLLVLDASAPAVEFARAAGLDERAVGRWRVFAATRR